jgi:hypothetical protein
MVEPEIITSYKLHAVDEGVSMAELMRRALRDYLVRTVEAHDSVAVEV